MQSTLTSTETDPHDIFVIEPDVVLAARADQAAPAPISSRPAPPIHPAPDLSATAPIPPVAPTVRAAAAADIEVPRDIHVLGQPSRGRWAGRAIIGFLFALGSAAAAAGWDHYGDAAKTVIANWTPFVLNSSPPPEKAAAAEQADAPDIQASTPAAAADQASAQPAPAAQPAQDTASTGTAAAASASTGTAPVVAAAAAPPSAPPTTHDLAAMGQQIEALKASIEQLKAGQEQIAQQMARNSAARTTPARTSQARPSDIKPADQSLRAKVTAALSPRLPPRKPRPAYPSAQVYAPSQSAALPPAIAAPPPPQPAQRSYDSQAQATDQADGDPVVRPPMPVR